MKLLTEIQIQHDYFEALKEGTFLIAPDTSTRTLLKKSAIYFKLLKNGCQIYTNDQSVALAKVDPIPISLRLFLYCKDPFFMNYTDLPFFATNKKILYFSNEDGSIDGKVQADHIVDIRSITTLKTGASNEKIRIETATGDLLKSVETDESGQIHLPNLISDDKIIFKYQDQILAATYPVSKVVTAALGVIHLKFTAEEITQVTSPKKWTIHFGNRATFWRYYLMNSQEKFEKCFIEDERANFEEQEDIKLPNGQKGTTLTANQAIALSERQSFNLTLNCLKKSPTNGRIIKQKIQLPYPQKSEVHPQKEAEGTKVYSNMFIYL